MRALFLPLGILTLVAVWFGPLPELAPGSFSAHMTMHMGVVAIAAPLLAFGIAGQRYDPVRAFPAWFPPIPLSVLELLVVWAWHTPHLHHLARHSVLGLVVEQFTFLLSGLLVWLSSFGGDGLTRANRAGAGVLALLLTSMHMTLLGALLALPPRPLYGHHAAAGAMSALEDQHLGGAIMLAVGGVAYLAGGVALMVGLLKGGRARLEPAWGERAHDERARRS